MWILHLNYFCTFGDRKRINSVEYVNLASFGRVCSRGWYSSGRSILSGTILVIIIFRNLTTQERNEKLLKNR